MVFARRHLLAIDIKVVASNAVQGGHRASIVAAVSDGGNGGQIVNHLVVAAEAFVHQTLEAALAKLVIIIGEIVPTHLVDDDGRCTCAPATNAMKQKSTVRKCFFICSLVFVFCFLV